MRHFLPIFAKITGFLAQLVFFKRKTYYEDRREQNRSIRGAAIVMSNHNSLLDFVLLFFLFPFRTLHFLIAEVMYRSGIMRWLLNSLGGIRVDRFNPDMRYMAQSMEVLGKGGVMGIFPEGRIIRAGDSEEYKPSIVYMALKSGAPIIPVYCDGSYGLFKRARAVIGKKIYLREYCDTTDPSPERVKELCAMLKRRVEALRALNDAAVKTHTGSFFSLRWILHDWVRISGWPLIRLAFAPKYCCASGGGRRIRGRAIVAFNHRGFWDPIMMSHTFMSRRVRTVAAEVLYENSSLMAWFLHAVGCIEIDRGALDAPSLNETLDVLRAGGVVGVFPEGRLPRAGEDMLEFHPGVVLTALLSGAPIIPVYIGRNYRLFHRQVFMVGEPVYLSDGDIHDIRRLEELAQRLRGRMLELRAELEKRGVKTEGVREK